MKNNVTTWILSQTFLVGLMLLAGLSNIAIIEIALYIVVVAYTVAVCGFAWGLYKYENNRPDPDHVDLSNTFCTSTRTDQVFDLLFISALFYFGFWPLAILWAFQMYGNTCLHEVAEYQHNLRKQRKWIERQQKLFAKAYSIRNARNEKVEDFS